MGDGICHSCRTIAPEFKRAVSFGEYEGALRGLVHLLKYEAVRPVAAVLGEMLARTLQELLPGCRQQAPPLLVPVPLHKSKRGERGFNQAEAIARHALKGVPQPLGIAADVLVRQRMTTSQVGLTREERIQNMHGAFRVSDRAAVRGRTIIVVDDVMTTGTTLSECARVLKRAGAADVYAVTVARTFHRVGIYGGEQDNEEEASDAVAITVSH
jgi:ComF family protein